MPDQQNQKEETEMSEHLPDIVAGIFILLVFCWAIFGKRYL